MNRSKKLYRDAREEFELDVCSVPPCNLGSKKKSEEALWAGKIASKSRSVSETLRHHAWSSRSFIRGERTENYLL